ncbi:MAG TPA: hypothetical protein VLB12_09390 [Gemmatimonadales bacterium]|nr:hypothetical protein [Gemmatimonadales bacterium]
MEDVLLLSNLCLVALVFFYSLNLGPMLFESFTSDRIWASNPPESFSMFLGPYGHKTSHYWRIVSPLTSLLFLLGLVLNWHAYARVLWPAVAFALYLTAQITTMAYFVPEQEGLIRNAESHSPGVLKARARRWLRLDNFRMTAGVLGFFALLCAVLARVPQ